MAQQIFTTPGADTFEVPAGITSITIKCWGAGGGSGASDDALANSFGERGGGGGFAQGTITVTPLDTLTIHVGGKGGGGTWVSTGGGGGGGGRSSVYNGATPYIVAAAGGGGGGGDNSNAASGVGGVGGGGTQSAGGALGTGGSNGTAGASLAGGNGGNSGAATGNGGENNGGITAGGDAGNIVTANFAGGGGGGSGYFGGGGGGGSVSGSAGGGGGGGGSNYVSGTDIVNTQAVAGTGAGQGDADYQAGTGDGGAKLSSLSTNGNDGEDGAVVIIWASVTYKMEGITKDRNGNVLGNCDCHLFKLSDATTISWIGFDESDSTGLYSIGSITDNDSSYFMTAWKDNTPHVFDAGDHVLTPVEDV